MSVQEIIGFLRENETEFSKIKTFSKLPGIYAIFFIGKDFPLVGDKVRKHEIIYIGKTESSQENRDAKTHFMSGKTGSSTVRKSIGSILCQELNLTPIPRNTTDYSKNRKSHFKFDDRSEDKITEWMKQNLALSFYEYPKSKMEIDTLETKIINELAPILNIAKNSNNAFKPTLQALRKNCATMAFMNSMGDIKPPTISPKVKKTNKQAVMNKSNFKTIYIDNITAADASKNKIRIKKANKELFPTEKIGESNTYDLEFKYGRQNLNATYKVGSTDGVSRSGILKFDSHTYNNVLKIKAGTGLKITKVVERVYLLDRL